MRATRIVMSLVLVFASGCGEDAPDPAPQTDEPAVDEPVEAETPTPAADPNEACARAIVVAFAGATAAADDVTRTEAEAQARAGELLEQLRSGADFAELARSESDARSSGPRGGMLGTYAREDFPEIHAPIRDAVFELEVGALSEPIRAPYGWVVASRCPVEKVHTRHLLIRYAGARNAGEDVTRSREEAEELATELRAEATAESFEALVREHSEDSSAENGGDIGNVGRGLLQPPYEEAAFALEEGALSGVVETAFGFHIIQRLAE